MSTPTASDPQSLLAVAALAALEVPAASEIVVQRLRWAIHRGTFTPGEGLPAEGELAARLGVARETLGEALRVLQSQRYLIIHRGPNGGP